MRLSDDAAIQFSSYFDQNRKLIEDSYNKKTDTLIISKENIIRGNNLLKYYNKHKLILAGYSIDVDEPILNVFTELINEFNPLDNSVEKKIATLVLLNPLKRLPLNAINQKVQNIIKIDSIISVCQKFELSNLGKYVEIVNTRGPPSKYFDKIKIEDFIFHH